MIISMRQRDLLCDEDRSVLSFAPLYGKTVKDFLGGDSDTYMLFPTMLTAPVFSKVGAERNASMKYALLESVMSQMIDISAFMFVCILGVVDSSQRAEFCTLLKSEKKLTIPFELIFIFPIGIPGLNKPPRPELSLIHI